MATATDHLRAIVAERGPVPYSTAVEVALYHSEVGFYATDGRAGRRGDFLTSPEVGPLFGAVLARALDAWWDEAGRPDRFTLIEAGAGPGALARSVLAARPVCSVALQYVLVERSAAQRASHASLLAKYPGHVASQAALPAPGGGPTVVLANELLDNLPFDLLERTASGWAEVLVGHQGDGLGEVLGPLPDDVTVPEAAAGAPVGARVPLQREAAAWLARALRLAGSGGRVMLFDYASTTDDLAARPIGEWLRTYRRHERGSTPLDDLGGQDVTCEVCVDQLAAVAPPTSNRTQADWLRSYGIGVLVDEGRRTWTERAHLGDLEAVKARSRITEAEALLDESGLGAFRALEWFSRR